MATRSRISYEKPDGTIRSIYCHWDGYIENNGRILLVNYNESNLDALMDLGDLSYLGEKPKSTKKGWNDSFRYRSLRYCLAYRDRGEDCPAKEFKSLKEYYEAQLDEECNYLFSNGEWFYWYGPIWYYGEDDKINSVEEYRANMKPVAEILEEIMEAEDNVDSSTI